MFKSRYLAKSKVKVLVPQLLIFLLLYFISMFILDSRFYLFRWTADNRYLYIWVLITILTVFDKEYIALFLTVGNIVGVIAGQFLGDYIEIVNLGRITPEMTDEMIWSSGLMHHRGFEIWITALIIALIAGIIWQRSKIRQLKLDNKGGCRKQ